MDSGSFRPIQLQLCQSFSNPTQIPDLNQSLRQDSHLVSAFIERYPAELSDGGRGWWIQRGQNPSRSNISELDQFMFQGSP